MHLIKIGGINYSLIKKDTWKEDNEPVWGTIDYRNPSIYVDKNLSLQKQKQTVVHESLHAMLHESGLDDYANDEKIVTPLGNALFSFMIENPELIKELIHQE